MFQDNSSGNTTQKFVVAPEFSLIYSQVEMLAEITSDAFAFANDKGRKALFRMRDLLNYIFPNGIRTPKTPDEHIAVANRLMEYITRSDLSKDIVIPYPGTLRCLFDSREYFQCLTETGDHFTLNFDGSIPYENSMKFLRYIAENCSFCNKKIYILVDRLFPKDLAETVCRLWKDGADLTVCYSKNIRDTLLNAGIVCGDNIDFYEGLPIIRGRSLAKIMPIDSGFLENEDNVQIIYSEIKDSVEDLLKAETASRFSRSSKGTLLYRRDFDTDGILPFGLLYKNCISDGGRKIKSIFTGGAEYDTVSVTVDGMRTESADIILRSLAAACKANDGYYPLRAMPYFRHASQADSIEDIRRIITDHSALTMPIYGGSTLVLSVSDSTDLSDSATMSKIVSAFFGCGGMMIKIKYAGG